MGIKSQLLHGSDVGGLHVVLVLLNASLEVIQGDLLVLDNQVDLELLDTEANSDELGGTPNQTVDLNRTDVGFHLLKVGLVIYTVLSAGVSRFVGIVKTYPKA